MTQTPVGTHAETEHRLGVLLVLGAAVAWSVSGVFARLITVDVWTATSTRALFAGLFMGIGLIAVHRGQSLAVALAMGRIGLFVACMAAVSMTSFTAAFYHTTVANVAVIYALTPFIAAALGWLILGETPSRRTMLAAGIALVGVAIMVGGAIGGGTWVGDLLALSMSASFAVVAVIVRANPRLEMLSTNGLGCLIAALIAAPFARFETLDPSNASLLAAFAFASTPLAFFMFLAGARRIPAAKAALLVTIEVVLSPLWVFLFFAEVPNILAIVGGAIVMAAVLWRIVGELRGAG
ncbi:MAG: DMT family transporter [Labrys sp. (in: a-proteobacteria)]